MTNSELEEEIYETYAEPTMNLQCSKDLTFFTHSVKIPNISINFAVQSVYADNGHHVRTILKQYSRDSPCRRKDLVTCQPTWRTPCINEFFF